MDILADRTLTDIGNLKGVGSKTCDETRDKLNQWIEANMLISEEGKDDIISEKERLFYQCLTGKLIYRDYAKLMKEMLLGSGLGIGL